MIIKHNDIRINLSSANIISIEDDLVRFSWGRSFLPEEADGDFATYMISSGVDYDDDQEIVIFNSHPGYKKIVGWVEANTI